MPLLAQLENGSMYRLGDGIFRIAVVDLVYVNDMNVHLLLTPAKHEKNRKYSTFLPLPGLYSVRLRRHVRRHFSRRRRHDHVEL